MSDPDQTPAITPATPGAPRRGAGRVLGIAVVAILLGAAVAALGTATQRTLWHDLPVGLVIALALTLSAGVLARAWSGLPALAGAAVGWVVMVELMSLPGSGGDVLVTDPTAGIPLAWAGIAWTYGGVVLLGVVAFLPRRWFERR
ncbi:MAG: hypothetical protein FWF90_00290 [Promicromonosporaceae bacterium]|nr:hypothetical protein [Promicromonosporaceae bacterium]